MSDPDVSGVLLSMKKTRINLSTPLLLILCLAALGSLLTGRMQPVSLDKALSSVLQAEIKGEVSQPGVYTLKRGDTLEALLKQAEGPTEQADLSALSLLEEVEDGAVVVIPARREKDPLISINTADAETLCQLKGIGPALAGRIIEYRKENPFEKLEDIQEVRGIGPKLFEKIREKICL